jgi:hypothetical protein
MIPNLSNLVNVAAPKRRAVLVPVAREQATATPRMACLQVVDKAACRAAFDLVLAEKARGALVMQADSEADAERLREAELAGQVAPVVYVLRDRSALLDTKPVRLVKEMVAALANALGSSVLEDGGDLGLTVTLTEQYVTKNYAFHRDAELSDPRLREAVGGADDFFPFTVVLYLMDEDARGEVPAGQGSTLYNLHQCQGAGPEVKVAACPLANGSMSIFPAADYHAVGPNPGIQRAAIVYKAVLFRSDAVSTRSTETWWEAMSAAITQLSPADFLRLDPPVVLDLCDVLRDATAAHERARS